jgi:hypothetical protein
LAKLTALVGLADTLIDASQSAKPTSQLSRSPLCSSPVGLADSPVADPANLPKKLLNQPSGTSSDVGEDLCDWRTPLLVYLRDPSAKVDKVFGEVLSNMCCTMSFTEEPPKTCC